jgi:glycosyltransferase involved in cell wall biosynthesis
VVIDGENGLLAPVGNPRALAERIERVLGDEALRERLVEGGKGQVAGRFEWNKVFELYRALLMG